MALSAITFYCVCDDLLRAMRHRDDRQCRLSCAEVMMVPLLAALCFGGNGALCRHYLVESGLGSIPCRALAFAADCIRCHVKRGRFYRKCWEESFVKSASTPTRFTSWIPCPLMSARQPERCVLACLRMKRIPCYGATAPAKSAMSMASRCIWWSTNRVRLCVGSSWPPARVTCVAFATWI